MKVEEIENEWAEDAKIDENRLGEASSRIPLLHHKYYKIMIRELAVYEKQSSELATLERNKMMWYAGWMTTTERNALGWPQWELTIPKTDVQKFINSDSDVIAMKLKVAIQNEKVNYLKSIMTQINGRNFIIKNMIDFKRFENGA